MKKVIKFLGEVATTIGILAIIIALTGYVLLGLCWAGIAAGIPTVILTRGVICTGVAVAIFERGRMYYRRRKWRRERELHNNGR